MFTPATEPQSIGGILDNGFSLFTASAKKVIAITYLGALATAIGMWFLQKSMLDQFAESGALGADLTMMVGTYTIMAIIGSIMMAAAVIRIRDVFMGEDTSFGHAMVSGVKRAPAVFGATIIYMLGFVVGLFLLVIPGIYLSVMLAFAIYAAATDNQGPIESIKYSYALVKGNWWRVTGLLTVVMIVAMVFYVAVGFVVGILAASDAPDPLAAMQPDLLIDVMIIPFITSVITAMMYCLVYAIYHDLKLRNEGLDLAERFENLDQA